MRTRSDGPVEFVLAEAADLDSLAVVAQSLDNQWVPGELLRQMLQRGRSLDDVRTERAAMVRGEYLRALVNSPQVIVNRAYVYNNEAVFGDFRHAGPDRDAFKALLAGGVIVPFLFDEPSPVEEPDFAVGAGLEAWRQVVQEARPTCARLSWDDDRNRRYIREQLQHRFAAFAQGLNLLDPAVLARDLGQDPDDDGSRALRARLTQIVHWCADVAGEGRLVTREELYRNFVVADGTETTEGRYDVTKPFAADIKQIVDLAYNVNLPDALDRFPLTPVDSPRRTALQEWHLRAQQASTVTPEELVDLLRRTAFDVVQSGLVIESLSELSLAEVRAVREEEAWASYIGRLRHLVAHPLEFTDPDEGARAVYEAYVELAKVISARASRRPSGRRPAREHRWDPVIEIVFEAAGAVLSVVFANPPIFQVAGTVAAAVGARAAPVVVRLVIRGMAERRAQARLSTGIDLMRVRFGNAKRDWDRLVFETRQLDAFTEVESSLTPAATANMDHYDDYSYV